MDGETIFMVLYVFTFIMVGLTMIAPVILIVVFVTVVRRIRDREMKEMTERALSVREQTEKRLNSELAMQKVKYQRVKCAYCGSLNEIGERCCVFCGGELEQRNGLREM